MKHFFILHSIFLFYFTVFFIHYVAELHTSPFLRFYFLRFAVLYWYFTVVSYFFLFFFEYYVVTDSSKNARRRSAPSAPSASEFCLFMVHFFSSSSFPFYVRLWVSKKSRCKQFSTSWPGWSIWESWSSRRRMKTSLQCSQMTTITREEHDKKRNETK